MRVLGQVWEIVGVDHDPEGRASVFLEANHGGLGLFEGERFGGIPESNDSVAFALLDLDKQVRMDHVGTGVV